MQETRYTIVTTIGRYVVSPDTGPLCEADETDDPADGAAAIWRRIDERGPIWTDGHGAMYLNPAHVVAIEEVS